VIEYDFGIRQCSREIGNFGDLRMVERHVIGKTQTVQYGNSFSKPLVSQHARVCTRIGPDLRRLALPGNAVADAPKAVASRAHQRVDDRLHATTQCHVRMSDDAGGHSGFTKGTATAHRGDAIGELYLAHRPHFLRAPVAVHRVRLHVHSPDNIVSAAGIGE